ncbi:MAG: DNA methyltransferase [Haloarculaceae archaeon]
METDHRIYLGNSKDLSRLDDDAVELVVTSPPYPMIEMWDDLFSSLDPAVETALDDGDGRRAFELMHETLAKTWDEVARVLVDGGIACINVGDATRKVDDSFRVYPNHARIIEYLDGLGFEPLPDILWRKPTNSAAKFMGSGMVPPNAYATLEHEYVLVFRNGTDTRAFPSGSERRYNSAYFWEERNEWFSDVWADVTGTFQRLDHADGDLRDRSAAYPLEIPYRLVNMYSVYGDTVLDPFWGTGTTSLAAMIAGRNSVGYEIREPFAEVFDAAVSDVRNLARDTVSKRIARHEAFVQRRRADGETFEYRADHYDFPVTTKQERSIRLYTIDRVEPTADGYRVTHSPYDPSGATDGGDTGNSDEVADTGESTTPGSQPE